MHFIIKQLAAFSLLMLTAVFTKMAAQSVTGNFEASKQLIRLQVALNDTTRRSFDATSIISYNNATKDTVHYHYKTWSGQLHMIADDSTEIVQNRDYRLWINHHNEQAKLFKATALFRLIAQVDILDHGFYQTFVSSCSLTDTGSYKKITWQFKAASPYRQYDIIYDSATCRIQSIHYCYGGPTGGSAGCHTPYHVTVTFSNYQTGGFTNTEFSLDPFCERKNGKFSMTAPYYTYNLSNTANQ